MVIAEITQIETIVEINKNKSANRIVGYISNQELTVPSELKFIANAHVNLKQIIADNHINEIIVSSRNFEFVKSSRC